jgi:hypothetical protein
MICSQDLYEDVYQAEEFPTMVYYTGDYPQLGHQPWCLLTSIPWSLKQHLAQNITVDFGPIGVCNVAKLYYHHGLTN